MGSLVKNDIPVSVEGPICFLNYVENQQSVDKTPFLPSP